MCHRIEKRWGLHCFLALCRSCVVSGVMGRVNQRKVSTIAQVYRHSQDVKEVRCPDGSRSPGRPLHRGCLQVGRSTLHVVLPMCQRPQTPCSSAVLFSTSALFRHVGGADGKCTSKLLLRNAVLQPPPGRYRTLLRYKSDAAIL